MRRRFRILLMGAVVGAAIAVPSTVMASSFAGRGETGMHMPGPMGMVGQMHGSAEDHEAMMQRCEAHMKEGHEGMMDEMGGMGTMR